MEDGVYGALEGQEAGQFFRTVEVLTDFLEMGGEIFVCGNCIKHRGISEKSLIRGVEVIDIHRLLQTMVEADQSLFF
jgi:sulfur relay (sulfurtransferase) complex TusBCD TusD component (DsrE family)